MPNTAGPPEGPSDATRRLALALTIATGFTALVYEVAWQKYLATLLGSHAEATAAVLAIFLGGLAAGYALFGILTRRLVTRAARAGTAPRLLAYYGALEAAIGVYAVVFPVLFAIVQALSVRIPHAPGGLGFAFDVVLAALLVAPPAILMGGTIPFLTQALARDLDDATRIHASVYACNTLGAFAGALAGGFWLVPGLGLVNVMIALGVVNVLVGAAFRTLDAKVPAPAIAPGESAGAPPIRGYAGYAAVALLTGFAMITTQTAVMRLSALSFGSSEFTFAMVVAVFVLCIALGSFAVSALRSIPAWALIVNQWLLALLLLWLYHRLPDGPYLAHRLRILFTTRPEAFYLYQLGAFLGTLSLLAAPVLLSGASLPLLFNHLRRRYGDLGGVAGRLYSWNTVGSFIGALAGGYALLFFMDLDDVFRIAVVAIGLGAILLGVLHMTRVALFATVVVGLSVAALLLALEPWSPRQLSPGLFRAWQPLPYSGEPAGKFLKQWWSDTKLPFYDDDPTVSVLVTETESPERGMVRSILVNGKSDSATSGDTPTTGLLAVLPALFADKLERAFVVGWGTGFTAGELASFGSMRDVTVAEISPAVLATAPLFDFANHNASQSEKIHFVRSDAYRALLRSEGDFDVIVSEPSNPWVTGVEMLYSREFLNAARSRLAPGGVFVQWFHQYATSDEAVELVLRTYAEAFDHVAVWHGLGSDLLLLGFTNEQSALDLERLEARAREPEFVAALGRSEVKSFPALLAHEIWPLGVLHATRLAGPVHTLLHPRLSHLAARAYFQGEAGQLPFSGAPEPARVGGENSLLKRYLARGFMLAGDGRRQAIEESCRHRMHPCAALFAQWYASEGNSQMLQQAMTQARSAGSRAFGGTLNPSVVAQLAANFLGDGPLQKEITPDSAQRATEMLRNYYQHAAPLRVDRLLTLWDRCVPPADAPDACTVGRAAALESLGLADSGPAESPEQESGAAPVQ